MPPGQPTRPRVLQVGPDVPGGMSAVIRSLIASPLSDRYELDLVPTYKGPSALRRLLVFLVALAEIVVWRARRRGVIVHIHATVRGSAYRKAACVLVAKAMRARVVLHFHSGPGDIDAFAAKLGRASHAYVGAAYRAADVVLAVSSRSAEAWQRAFGPRQVVVLANPVAAVTPVASGRGEDERLLVLFLGGFANPVKGGKLLLGALREEPLAAADVVLAGPGELPAGELPAAVEWRGWVEPAEKAALLSGADVFVLPSTSEGLPVALLEAMAYGLAIVATDVGGVPDVVADGFDALIVEPGEPAALVAAISRLVGDPRLRRELGAAARARAAELRPEAIAARLDAIYRPLL
jgi:glycosyltransferase involved in cell wall biosynthesis